MKILILGARGNLGTQLVKVFEKNKENEVYGWDREEINILDKELTLNKIKEQKPDIIINAIAYNAVDACEENNDEFELAQKLNIETPALLASLSQEIGAIFIHYSSDYVFAGIDNKGYTEKSPTNPINKYGYTKAQGEKEIARIAINGLKWYLIRTSKLFGPKGESDKAKPSFFDIMLKLSKEKDEIKVVNDEKGYFTYTPDLALATKNLVLGKLDYGIYHITNSEEATWYEACLSLFEITGAKTKITPITAEEMPRPAKRPKYSKLLNTKTRTLRSYKEGLSEYLNN